MPDKILRNKTVLAITGLSRTTIHRLEKAGNFPKRIQLGARAVGYKESEIQRWIETRENPVS